MPNYTYECLDCHHIFEIKVSIEDMEKECFSCNKCHSQNTKRVFDGFGYCKGGKSNSSGSGCSACRGGNCSTCSN